MSQEDTQRAGAENSSGTGFIGRKAIYYPVITSTMDAARQEARRGTVGGTVIIAGEQTSGRGRMKRNWQSPRGNVALSIILYPSVSALPFLVIIAALAVSRSIESITGLNTAIKWPNDVLLSGKKVGGILIENEVKKDRVSYAIVGIGVNVEVSPQGIKNSAVPATSLRDEIGGNILRTNLIRHILRNFEEMYLALPDTAVIMREWRSRLQTLGRNIVVDFNGEKLEGIAESVDDTGALQVRGADGGLTTVVAGDVSLREAGQ